MKREREKREGQKIYCAPELTVYGSVETITRFIGAINTDGQGGSSLR